MKKLLPGLLALMLGLAGRPAGADINVGVILSLTGNAASLGIPARNTVEMWPKSIAGQPLKITVLDDASDPTAATLAARKLISEQKVDVLVGPSVTATAMSVMQVAAETRTPNLSLGGGGALVLPMDDVRRWVYKLPPGEHIPVGLILKDLNALKLKRLAVMATSNAYGQVWLDNVQKAAPGAQIDVVAVERFAAADTSFVSQALKVIAAKPDAVFIVATGTPTVSPQLALLKLGYKGQVYQTVSFALSDFLRVGGREVEGTRMATSTALIPEQLADGNPIKAVALAYIQAYQAKYNERPQLFGAVAWDAYLLLEKAVPAALAKGQPGTEAFRAALRQGVEDIKEIVLTEGIYSMTPQDHNGADERSLIIAEIRDGQWKVP